MYLEFLVIGILFITLSLEICSFSKKTNKQKIQKTSFLL